MSKFITQTFPMSIKPVHDGVYRVVYGGKFSLAERYSEWKRGQWHIAAESVEEAKRYAHEGKKSYDCYQEDMVVGWYGVAQ